MKNELFVDGIASSIAYCEAMGLSKVFKAYADKCPADMIESIGFNASSGYVYIALEDGISICSCLGRDVEFLCFNFEDGTEHFFDEYNDAQNFIKNLYQTT